MGGVILPYSLGGSAASWQPSDFLDEQWRSQPAAGGRASIEVPQLASDELWSITRAVVTCDSATPTTVRLYADQEHPLNLRSGSNTGNFDEADYPGALQLPPSTALLAVWTGASDGATATLHVSGTVMRRA